jgi:poly-gamma-glutamate synthesis protein (capsule biosynthesis protein)
VCEHEYSYALENRMGSRPYDEYDTMADIRAARPDCDRLIVIYHGGKESCRYPSPRLFKACRAMVDNGADVVLCQHSHCIGCYENYKGAHILYGQGNFHFVKPPFLHEEDEQAWNTSLAVKYDTETNEIAFVPLTVYEEGIAQAKGEEAETILSDFASRNAELASGAWRERWHAFCMTVKEQYIKVLAEAFAPGSTKRQDDNFGHYLDCEAHADVFREICPTANHTNEI